MQTGDIVLIDFPYTSLIESKIRPEVVVNITNDKFKDVIICLISSIIPGNINKQEILLDPDSTNNLRSVSIIKVYRVATVKTSFVISVIGKLRKDALKDFKEIFKTLVD